MKLPELADYFQHDLYEMSTYFSDDTGLSPGTKLWIRTEPTGLPHTKYRIKIEHPQKGSAVFSLWGDEIQQVAGDWQVSGKDLRKISMLVKLTGDALRSHINGDESSFQLGLKLLNAKKQVEQA